MLGNLMRGLFGSRESKSQAKSRLHFVLVQDRSGLTGDDMSKFREEIVDVIGRYFIIDKSGFDVSYKRSGDSTTLLINSPVVVKRQEGVKNKVGARMNHEASQSKDPSKDGAKGESSDSGSSEGSKDKEAAPAV